MTWRHSSKVVSVSGLKTATPALFTSASIRPKRCAACANAFVTCCGSDTSQVIASTRSPCSRASAAPASASTGASMSTSTAASPRDRNILAIASPMPRAAPVTTATRGEVSGISSP